MGWSKGSSSSTPTYTAVESSSEEIDYGAMLEGMMTFLAESQQQTTDMLTQVMLNDYSQEPTDLYSIDYETENQSLMDRLAEEAEDMEDERKGVLGTILTALQDDPSTTKPSLLIEDDDEDDNEI